MIIVNRALRIDNWYYRRRYGLLSKELRDRNSWNVQDRRQRWYCFRFGRIRFDDCVFLLNFHDRVHVLRPGRTALLVILLDFNTYLSYTHKVEKGYHLRNCHNSDDCQQCNDLSCCSCHREEKMEQFLFLLETTGKVLTTRKLLHHRAFHYQPVQICRIIDYH